MKRFRSTAYFHTPPNAYRHIFHSVLRAGHHRAAPQRQIGNWTYPGHDLVLTVAGTAVVQIQGRPFTMGPGDVVWIDCNHLDTLWPPRPQPWEIFWMHVDSPQINAMAETLQVNANPVFSLRKAAGAVDAFKTILRILRARPVAMEAALHAAVTSLLSILFETRQSAASTERPASSVVKPGRDLAKVLEAMRADYQRHWTVGELARLMNLSQPQFFRRFSMATGSTPMDWLRRERINQAKRHLVETSEPIRDIGEEVGYRDQHYFSRDFKKLAGVSPRQYRLQERALYDENGR